MFFASDNAGPTHPAVMRALSDVNAGYMPSYGDDPVMTQVRDAMRALFEAPNASVHLVATGTAANALALATMTQPFQTVFCSPVAHIHEDECNAPEFYMGGAKLTLVGDGDRITPDALRAAILAEGNRGVHGPQRGPVSITSVTERGTVYSVAEITALADLAHGFDLPLHLDGARFGNAVSALGCTPAEMTWKAGVDALSFGGTKNGCMGVEAVVFFNPEKAWEFELRRKRGGHLFSKHRYLSAQMQAYLAEDLWRDLAAQANARAAHLETGLRRIGAGFLWQRDANMIFATLPRAAHKRLFAAGAMYHLWDGDLDGPDDAPLGCRLVCDWSVTEAQIDRFIDIAAG